MSGFKFANTNNGIPATTDLNTGFTIKAPTSSDIWAKPPSKTPFNAPILHRACKLSSFNRARVHVAANWRYLYDQGGLILVLHRADGSRKWVKTGIEFTHGKPHVGTVAKDNWADWSLLPVPGEAQSVTVELCREADGSLWVYTLAGVQRNPIRKITWAFQEQDTTEAWIGVYAAKPSAEGEDLAVTYKQLEIDISA